MLFSRIDGVDLGVIRAALEELRAAGSQVGLDTPVNVCIGARLVDNTILRGKDCPAQ